MKKYSHYFRANARYILVVRDEIGYAQYLHGLLAGDNLELSTILNEYFSERDIEKIAFDDEDLLFLVSGTAEDLTHAETLSKGGERPYAISKAFNLSQTFASRCGRSLNVDALAKIAENIIIGIGQTIGALYVEYQLGIDAETNVKLLAYSADSKFEATEEELAAKKDKFMEDIFNKLTERLKRMPETMKD